MHRRPGSPGNGGSPEGQEAEEKPTDNANVEQPRVRKYTRIDGTEKVASRRDSSWAARSKKHKSSTNEDAPEPKSKREKGGWRVTV